MTTFPPLRMPFEVLAFVMTLPIRCSSLRKYVFVLVPTGQDTTLATIERADRAPADSTALLRSCFGDVKENMQQKSVRIVVRGTTEGRRSSRSVPTFWSDSVLAAST